MACKNLRNSGAQKEKLFVDITGKVGQMARLARTQDYSACGL